MQLWPDPNNRDTVKICSRERDRSTHGVFHTDHPAPANNFPILPHRTHRICRVFVGYPETIHDLGVQVGVGAFANLFEVFDGDAVLVCGVAKDDYVDGFSGVRRGGGGRFR